MSLTWQLIIRNKKMLDGNKIRDWAYLLLRGQETIAERERVKGTLRRARKLNYGCISH